LAAAAGHIGPAYAVTPFQAGSWTEEEARAEFIKMRFARWGGVPACERCDTTAVIRLKCRPAYKCKLCDRHFSDTSGSPWANRKLPFRKLMYLIACFAANKQAKTALSLCEDLGVQYKTVLLWLHKMRLQIAVKDGARLLSGEVEADGAEAGGHIRPKNVRKSTGDHRKFPYKAKDRTFHAVAARQRGNGPIRTWVARSEADAVPFVNDSILKGSTVFTDMAAHWSRLRAKVSLQQVNHKIAYSTPEACTNQIETLWALLRVMGRVHRHIAQQYFDLYLAEAAWTLRKGKMGPGDAFQQVMEAMSVSGVSPLAGYFQGKKRSLPICNRDGSISNWKPDPNRRPMRPNVDGTFAPVKTRRPLAKTWREDFEFIPANELLANPKAMPNQPGVYALFVRDARSLLTEAGYVEQVSAPIWSQGDAHHVYSGESYAIRDRVLEHLSGNWHDNLRKSLLALGWSPSPVIPHIAVADQVAEAELLLNSWLAENVTVAFRVCGYVKDVEDAMLMATASPLNLTRSNPSATLRGLKEARKSFSQGVAANWPAGPAPRKMRR